MSEGLNLKIADIVFSILPMGNIKGFSLDKEYMPFKTDDEPDVVLETVTANVGVGFIRPEITGLINQAPTEQKPLFDASIWNYEQADGRHIFNFSLSSKNNRPERSLVLDNDFKKGEIILAKTVRARNGILRNPFSYPLDQILTIALLPKKQGILLHSCGFKHKDKGYLFIGQSGAGKSTMSKIMEKNEGVHILNDDRIAARKKNGVFYIYGTPWHGTAEFVSSEKASLAGLFFLKKDTENSLKKISIPDTVSRLIKYSFPPFWDRDGIASALKTVEDIATSIPCFEFSFLPDDRAFEMVKDKFLI
ncbi:MAG: hypothetical protein HZB79_09240 [Deltaproteobacteria bacterium]|nr:hypothetical protein [Deltaproteobacteria bacterium]